MQSGFYISGVAAYMAQHRLNDTSQNLANVNTTGYLASRSAFSTQFAEKLANHSTNTPAAYVSYSNDFSDMRKGSIKQTGNDLDFAIQGHGFFRIGLADGSEAYTRAGNFHLDAGGKLLTQDGRSVLDTNGNAIQLPPGHITVNQEGVLFVDDAQVAKFGLIQVRDTSRVEKVGAVLLKTPVENTTPVEAGVNVHQGALESSNVNAILAMAEMVDTLRSYQATMKVVEQYNQQASQLNERVGRIQG